MKYLVTILILATICLGADYMRGPNIPAVTETGNYQSGLTSQKPLNPPDGFDQHIVTSVPDLRSTSGSPGKNIVFAEDGQNVAVIYGLFSGDPTNFFQVYVSYSSDRGNNWTQYGPLSTYNCRRCYCGLDATDNWPDPSDLRVHFAWQQTAQVSGAYDSSSIFYAKEVSYPDGLITAAFRMPNSGTWDLWFPGFAVKDNYIVMTAGNNGTFLTTNDCYIWRSTDYGETWDDGRLFQPGPLDWNATPHMRFGNNGYIFFLWNRQEESNPSLYWPYFCESFDYGATWTTPQVIWQGNPPYPDMSNVGGWWYTYDCAVVNDTPVAAMKLGSGTYDYGELWVYRPTSGGPGSWQFTGTRLVGGDSTAPQTIERYACLAQDDRGDIFLGYQAIFESPTDTGPDAGMFVRPYNQNVWKDWGLITNDASAIEEQQLEFAHNAPIVGTAPNDSAVVGFIHNNAADYPTTGNLYFDYEAVPIAWIDIIGIAEVNHPTMDLTKLEVTPNPFRSSVKFMIPTQNGETKISIFDATGKLVRELNTTTVWNGRNSSGIKVNAGVYFYNVATRTGKYQGKLILTQ
jgi:Secretion system C-terminal sorting domain